MISCATVLQLLNMVLRECVEKRLFVRHSTSCTQKSYIFQPPLYLNCGPMTEFWPTSAGSSGISHSLAWPINIRVQSSVLGGARAICALIRVHIEYEILILLSSWQSGANWPAAYPSSILLIQRQSRTTGKKWRQQVFLRPTPPLAYEMTWEIHLAQLCIFSKHEQITMGQIPWLYIFYRLNSAFH